MRLLNYLIGSFQCICYVQIYTIKNILMQKHRCKQTRACSMRSYQPIGLFFGGVSMCSRFDFFFIFFIFYMFTLLSLFNSSTIFTHPSNSIFILNEALLMAISEAQVEGRSPATRTEKSWQTNRKPIKPKRHE